MAKSRIAAAAGHAGLSHTRNRVMAREIDLAVKEAILNAMSEGIQDPVIIRSRLLAARERVKNEHR